MSCGHYVTSLLYVSSIVMFIQLAYTWDHKMTVKKIQIDVTILDKMGIIIIFRDGPRYTESLKLEVLLLPQ